MTTGRGGHTTGGGGLGPAAAARPRRPGQQGGSLPFAAVPRWPGEQSVARLCGEAQARRRSGALRTRFGTRKRYTGHREGGCASARRAAKTHACSQFAGRAREDSNL